MLYQELVCKLPQLGHEVFFSLPDRYPAQVAKAFDIMLYPIELHPQDGDDRTRTYNLWFTRPKSV
jgi:hypothetical protein